MTAKVINRESRFVGMLGEAVPTDDDADMEFELIVEFPDGRTPYFRREEVELIP